MTSYRSYSQCFFSLEICVQCAVCNSNGANGRAAGAGGGGGTEGKGKSIRYHRSSNDLIGRYWRCHCLIFLYSKKGGMHFTVVLEGGTTREFGGGRDGGRRCREVSPGALHQGELEEVTPSKIRHTAVKKKKHASYHAGATFRPIFFPTAKFDIQQ